MKKIILSFAAALAALSATAAAPTCTPVDGYPGFALGADLSWTTYIDDIAWPQYYRDDTVSADNVTTILQMTVDHRFDAVRLRVWVDPKGRLVADGFDAKIDGTTWQVSPTHGYCDAEDLLRKAKMFADNGLRVMVCFHLSDTWADPARQFIPQAWSDCRGYDELKSRVTAHIKDVLLNLRDANINVEWVQIGNETSSGMLKYLLPEKSGETAKSVSWGCAIAANNAASTRNFVDMVAAASAAAKQVYPDAKTLIHIAEGNNWSRIDWTLSTIAAQGFDTSTCDMVGLSLYPCSDSSDSRTFNYTAQWKNDADRCIATIANLTEKYGFRTLLCELGMNNEWSLSTPSSEIARLGSQAANIAQCDADVKDLCNYLVDKLKDTPSTCDGIFYWEPEVDYLDDYNKGACHSITPGSTWPRDKVAPNPFWGVWRDNSDFPAGGLKEFYATGTSITAVEADTDCPTEYYTMQGIRVSRPIPGTICIERSGTRVTKTIIPNI